MYIGIQVNYRYSCSILMKLEFYRQIFENTPISNFMTIRPMAAQSFNADGRAVMTKPTGTFAKIGNVPKIHYLSRKLSSQSTFITHIRGHNKMP